MASPLGRMALLLVPVVFLLSCGTSVYSSGDTGVDANPWKKTDKAVSRLSEKSYTDLDELVTDLERVADTEWEKTRAIWFWITHNISYDTTAYFGKTKAAYSPEEVLVAGRSVCSGYAGLFLELGTRMGLEVIKVSGYAKGYGYDSGKSDPGGANHAWNAIRIDGQWHLFDSTWGAGGLNDDEFLWQYKEFYFDTSPDLMILSHYPTDSVFQLLDSPLSRELFFSMPYQSWAAMNMGLSLSEIVELVSEGWDGELPEFQYCYIPASLEAFPVTDRLAAGKTYEFSIVSEARFAMIEGMDEDQLLLENSGGGFQFEVVPSYDTEDLVISLSLPDTRYSDVPDYYALLMYLVE